MSKLCEKQETRGKFFRELYDIIQSDMNRSDMEAQRERGERMVLMPPVVPLVF